MAVEKFEKFAGETSSNKVPAYGSDQPAPVNRELLLSFRRLDGSEEAFQYIHLYNVRRNKEATEVVLTYSNHVVMIEGERLTGLYNALLGCGIQFVQEMKEEDRIGEQPYVKIIGIAERIVE